MITAAAAGTAPATRKPSAAQTPTEKPAASREKQIKKAPGGDSPKRHASTGQKRTEDTTDGIGDRENMRTKKEYRRSLSPSDSLITENAPQTAPKEKSAEARMRRYRSPRAFNAAGSLPVPSGHESVRPQLLPGNQYSTDAGSFQGRNRNFPNFVHYAYTLCLLQYVNLRMSAPTCRPETPYSLIFIAQLVCGNNPDTISCIPHESYVNLSIMALSLASSSRSAPAPSGVHLNQREQKGRERYAQQVRQLTAADPLPSSRRAADRKRKKSGAASEHQQRGPSTAADSCGGPCDSHDQSRRRYGRFQLSAADKASDSEDRDERTQQQKQQELRRQSPAAGAERFPPSFIAHKKHLRIPLPKDMRRSKRV